MNKKLIILFAIATTLTASLGVSASELPEPMVGFTTLTKGEVVYHIGMGANQAIFNTDPNLALGFTNTIHYPTIPAATETVQQCIDAVSSDPFDLSLITRCFWLTPDSYGDYLMTGRAYRGDSPQVELAALIYDKVIMGDVFGLDSGVNFSLYGRNLKQKSPYVSNETWNAGDTYTLNPEAQSSLSEVQAEYVARRIREVAGEAQIVNHADLRNSTVWYLQGSTISDSGQSDAFKYPEGKTWIVNGCNTGGEASCLKTVANKIYKYRGKGTIIFLHNNGGFLEMSVGSRIGPENPASDSLGIIVAERDSSGGVDVSSAQARLDFKGGNYINAAVLSLGKIKSSGGGNIKGEGSFVADSFDFSSSAGSIVFLYNPMLEDNWPPSFRFFNMPQPDLSSQ